MSDEIQDRRQHERVGATFVVSYKLKDSEQSFGLSQTSNFSQGGLLLTTSSYFNEGDHLQLNIMLPLLEDRIEIHGSVQECTEIVVDLMYTTRICFLKLNQETADLLAQTVKEHGESEGNEN